MSSNTSSSTQVLTCCIYAVAVYQVGFIEGGPFSAGSNTNNASPTGNQCSFPIKVNPITTNKKVWSILILTH